MVKKLPSDRKNEKGAALITVLMLTFLLLVACTALILSVSINTANVTDAVSEQQAYYAAESGIQAALNVLRRHTTPSPLLDSTKSSDSPENEIDYARAIKLGTSNAPDDPATDARLSRWLRYNYTSSGASYPDRVTIGSDAYHPQTGSAYSVTIVDPDNPQKIIALTTSASIGGGGDSKSFGIPLVNGLTIKYNGATSGNVDVSVREANVNLGSFTLTRSGFADAPVTDTPFEITVKMTAPLTATVKVRGTIKSGLVSSTSVGSVRIVLDSPVTSLLGGAISIPVTTITPNAPSVNGGKTDLSTNLGVTITLSQPRRLLIRATGYGPRGARKVIEAIVQRNNFDGLIPSTVTLVGNTVGSVFKSSTSLLQQVSYSGTDVLSNAKVPPIGIIDPSNSGGGLLSGLLGTLTGILCQGCTVSGNPAEFSQDETPDFLKSATNLNSKLDDLRVTAKSANRYYSAGQTPPNFGNSDGTGITFIDGDANLTGAGGGILVVTGKLTLNGAFNFNGTILATGEQGVNRSGGGTGVIQGNLVVAPYKVTNLVGGFLPPKYDMTGGAISSLVYNTSNLLFGSDNYSTVVVGVCEK